MKTTLRVSVVLGARADVVVEGRGPNWVIGNKYTGGAETFNSSSFVTSAQDGSIESGVAALDHQAEWRRADFRLTSSGGCEGYEGYESEVRLHGLIMLRVVSIEDFRIIRRND